jgi:hypothetical protein
MVMLRPFYVHCTILEPYSCTVHVLDLLLEYNSMALRCYATVDRYDRYPYMYLVGTRTTEVRYSVDTLVLR